MTTTAARTVHWMAELVDGIRAAVAVRAGWSDTAELVAGELRQHLPGPDVLTAEQRAGSADDLSEHVLHTEQDGSFSIVCAAWRTGQSTRIHDHITWCALGVIQGVEHEELFDADLNLIGHRTNHAGDVHGYAPPGDIHRLCNTGTTTVIAIHVYGTDLGRVGSSARNYYV